MDNKRKTKFLNLQNKLDSKLFKIESIIPFPLEIIFAIIVSIGILILNYGGKSIGENYKAAGVQSLFLSDTIHKENHELEDILLRDVRGPVKKIEIYERGNDEPLSQLLFTPDDPTPGLVEMEKLRKIVEENEEGQAVVDVGGRVQAIYFQWCQNRNIDDPDKQSDRLVLIFSSTGIFNNPTIMDIIAYASVFSVWLILYIMYKHKHDVTKEKFDALMKEIYTPITNPLI